MKKNFLTAAAIMVTAFFVGTEVAKAADVTFSGQIRTRYEVNEQSGGASGVTGIAFSDTTEADDFTSTRVRLNANVNVNDSTSAFIQMQSNRQWGNTAGGTFATGAGSGNASFSGNDTDASVGLHQAYFTLKNFATLPVDLQVGRQEVVLDGHRLFGNTGWTQGAQTHDAMRLTHAHDNMALAYLWVQGLEDGRSTDTQDANDDEVHVAYFSYEGILGGKFSLTYAYALLGCTPNATGTACASVLANDFHTIGARQAGQLFGIDYRGEFYYQWGDGNGSAAALGNFANSATQDIDRDAYMFGIRVGKAFNNVMMKPGLTVWYDYLSGTDDDERAANELKTFDTLFDTGHKFYGFMDLYTNSTGTGTDGLGLQDIAIKAKIEPMPGWTLKADYHWFYTAEGVGGNPNSALSSATQVFVEDSSLGNELDVTLIHKYNANTNISFGYSNYTTTAAFRAVNLDSTTTNGDDANWAYVMFDVKF